MPAAMIWVVLVMSSLAVPSMSQTELGCKRKCGNVTIPYPFGIEDDQRCFQDAKFNLFCNETYDPPILFMKEAESTVSVLNIYLEGQATMAIPVAADCYTQDGKRDESKSYITLFRFDQFGYRFSETRNKFTVIGCDTQASMTDNTGKEFQSSCISLCKNLGSVSNNSCDGIGCCQTAIPKEVNTLNVTLLSINNHLQSWSFNPCSYAFLADVN